MFFGGIESHTAKIHQHGVIMNTEYKHLVISFIFAEIYIYTLYLNSLATVKKTKTKHKQTKKGKKKHKYSNNYHKNTRHTSRRCSVFCTKYYTCTTKYKENKHEGKYIHIINYGLFCEIQKEFKYSLSSDSFNVSKLQRV